MSLQVNVQVNGWTLRFEAAGWQLWERRIEPAFSRAFSQIRAVRSTQPPPDSEWRAHPAANVDPKGVVGQERRGNGWRVPLRRADGRLRGVVLPAPIAFWIARTLEMPLHLVDGTYVQATLIATSGLRDRPEPVDQVANAVAEADGAEADDAEAAAVPSRIAALLAD